MTREDQSERLARMGNMHCLTRRSVNEECTRESVGEIQVECASVGSLFIIILCVCLGLCLIILVATVAVCVSYKRKRKRKVARQPRREEFTLELQTSPVESCPAGPGYSSLIRQDSSDYYSRVPEDLVYDAVDDDLLSTMSEGAEMGACGDGGDTASPLSPPPIGGFAREETGGERVLLQRRGTLPQLPDALTTGASSDVGSNKNLKGLSRRFCGKKRHVKQDKEGTKNDGEDQDLRTYLELNA